MSLHSVPPVETLFSIPHLLRAISNCLTCQEIATCLLVCKDWLDLFQPELDRQENARLSSVRDSFYLTPWIFCELLARHPARTELTWQEIESYHPRPTDPESDSDETGYSQHHYEEDHVQDKDDPKSMACLFVNNNDNDILNNEDTQLHISNSTQILITERLRVRLASIPPLVSIKIVPGDDPRPHVVEPALARILLNLPPTVQCLDLDIADEWSPGDSDEDSDEGSDEDSDEDSNDSEDNNVEMATEHNPSQFVETIHSALFKHRDHRALKSIRIDFAHLAGSWPYLNAFLTNCCPSLKRLHFKSDAYINSGFVEPRIPRLGGCIALEELELDGPFRVGWILETMASVQRLRILTLDHIENLQRHEHWTWSTLVQSGVARTLESVSFKTTWVKSADLQVLLANCQSLQHFVVDTKNNLPIKTCLYLRHMLETPWVCLGLKTLWLPIVENGVADEDCVSLTPLSEHEQGPPHKRPKQRHPAVRKVHQRLAQLTKLETLKIGVVQEYHNSGGSSAYWTASTIGFDFSIESGLGILSSLKKLRHLAFFLDQPGQSFQPALGQLEVEWLAAAALPRSCHDLDNSSIEMEDNGNWSNWPELQTIQLGTRRPAAVIKGQEQKEMMHWNWLKQHRPDITVFWSS
ncbi:hypothetical protein BGZ83_000168 [Gryganskiella cystojenkinii]|nr:hypothetical protein BGZ83_000168 [Gryganskiella cystojenkinii]